MTSEVFKYIDTRLFGLIKCFLRVSKLFCFSAALLLGIQNTTYAQLFTEVAIPSGVDVTSDHNFWGLGISFYDWDKDGWADISYCKSNAPPSFYHNLEGTFEEVSFNIPNTHEAKHLIWVDYDNDSDADLFLTRAFGPWSLYNNDGNFNFTDVTSAVGISQVPNGELALGTGAAWADINNDGFLDVYIGVYYGPGQSSTNRLYINQGGNQFSNISSISGANDSLKATFQPLFFDADLDGWPDLHVINDRAFFNSFYSNNGNSTFTDHSASSGLNVSIDAMSNTPGDYDNDGDLDLYITNNEIEGNILFINNGIGEFLPAPTDSSHTLWKFSWGSQWIDQNLDGHLDLFVCTSGLYNYDTIISNHFSRNNGDGTFEYIENSGLEDYATRSYCAAMGDFDNNGAPDLALSCKSPFRNELWQNNNINHTYIKLSLEGTDSNRDAIGSTVYCYSNGIQQMKYTTCGEAYLSQNSQYLIFGLNGENSADSIIVNWPSGTVDKLFDQPANQTIHLVEGFSQNPVAVNNTATELGFFISGRTMIFDNQTFASLQVHNTKGQLVYFTETISNNAINLGNLTPGIYIARIKGSGNELFQKKFVLE